MQPEFYMFLYGELNLWFAAMIFMFSINRLLAYTVQHLKLQEKFQNTRAQKSPGSQPPRTFVLKICSRLVCNGLKGLYHTIACRSPLCRSDGDLFI